MEAKVKGMVPWLMRSAPNQTMLMQMLAPNWNDWSCKIVLKFLMEARAIWGLKAA